MDIYKYQLKRASDCNRHPITHVEFTCTRDETDRNCLECVLGHWNQSPMIAHYWYGFEHLDITQLED